ncbi:hypothetical protein [Streptomyces gobiensis]|uniref:hypothetical protein n=1 Tax=Streptomyces gobiensis TaxID=2875706 RepID=UPI001E416182|nr:hypothetical protein [Streptomyces gobiensis]UGY92412.1 hypothetical protein test1122_12225 [Streptomyces gobiensis]
MADVPRRPDTGLGSDRGSPPGMPRWVKVSGIVVAALVLLAITVKVTGLGGGDHGPGRHTGTGLGGYTLLKSDS